MGYLRKPVPENFVDCVFTQTEQVTVSNTTTETSLVGDGSGSVLFPADYFSIGKTIEVRTAGLVSGANNDTATVRVYLGTNKLIESVATIPAAITDAEYDVWIVLTCIAADTFMGQGYTRILAGVGLQTAYTRPLKMTAPVTIDTSAAHAFDITYQWNNARTANTITATSGYITAIK